MSVEGLFIRKELRGWNIVHRDSGIPVLRHNVRLRKHAAEALAELKATGIDWTKDAKVLARETAWRQVLGKWAELASNGNIADTFWWRVGKAVA